MQNLVHDEMKLNKFVHLELPSNEVLFLRSQGIKLPISRHDVPVADFTSREIERTAQASNMVINDYNDYLKESQMPIDTDTSKSSLEEQSSSDE